MVGAALAACLPLAALADDPQVLLPDLVADPPEVAYLQHYTADVHGVGVSDRLLLRFPGYVTNAGAGPLDVQGDPRTGALVQYGSPTGGGALVPVPTADLPGPTVTYSTTDGHNHWHLANAVEYSLWDEAGAVQVRPASKVGFCLYDSERVGTQGPAQYVYDATLTGDFCRRAQPDASALRMGVSAGWRDVYPASLAFQWVDVSDVTPGRYRLGARPDPGNVVRESDETNATRLGNLTVTVPGYVASAVGPVRTASATPVEVRLTADTYSDPAYGEPEARRFRIVGEPVGGTLTAAGRPIGAGGLVPVGTDTVVYTPRDGTRGTDTFTFAAEDSGSGFPTDAAGTAFAGATVATATVTVDDPVPPAVGISGAPTRLAAGARVRLRARVTGVGGGVRWSVNGVRGGTVRVGRITAGGVYTAPDTPPAAPVMIRATSVRSPAARAGVRVRILPAPGRVAAPTAVETSLVRGLLSRPAVIRRGTRLVASVRVGASGVLVVQASRDGRVAAACRSTVRRGARVACSLRVGPAGRPLVVRARLVADDPSRTITLRRTVTR